MLAALNFSSMGFATRAQDFRALTATTVKTNEANAQWCMLQRHRPTIYGPQTASLNVTPTTTYWLRTYFYDDDSCDN